MSDAVGVALVGYGLAGKIFHAPLITATSGLELRVVVSSDPAKVRADLPGADVLDDFADALVRADINLVIIATPDDLHLSQAEAAIKAGKHVVIDKPFAPSVDDARRIAGLAAARGTLLTVFQNRRWNSDFLTLKRLIADGVLGDIVQFESHFDRYRPLVKEHWKDRRDNGIWQDLGPHLVDQALQLFGLPRRVYAD